MEKKITTTILNAAKKHIPRGTPKKYKPFWNSDIQTAVTIRQQARKTLENEPSLNNKIAYNKATAKAKQLTALAKREKWRETCATLDLRKDGNRAWRLLNNLSGKKQRTNPTPMTDGETAKKRSEKFNKFFASINKSRTDKDQDKIHLKELKAREKSKTGTTPLFEDPLTLGELDQAIKQLKQRKAPGPDKIHNEMINHLGIFGKKSLLHLINMTWEKGQLPRTWKNAFISPILKKDKDPKEPGSYRPISLTSCIGKVGERMINRRLYWWLEDSEVLSEVQAGFRAGSRTEDQLFRLCQDIQDGFQDSKHTTAVFIDLQQAYDRVWRKGLLLKMQRMGICGKIYHWIKNFLMERTIQTQVENELSSKKVLEDGLPQGSALSCTLFLIFINDMGKDLKSQRALYADDLVVWRTNKYPLQTARHLNQDLEKLSAYCKEWKLTINPTKTVYSTFTNSPKASKQELEIRVEGQKVSKDKEPTYLGVQLDSRLTLNKHVDNLKKKATKRLALVKRLASTNWGSDINTLRSLYIGYIRSVLDYNQCLQISSSKSTQAVLDKIQNHALRFICGGMRSTPTSTCEIHTNIEPLGLRREKSVLELYERTLRMPQKHPSRKLVENWKVKKKLKHQSILHHAHELRKKCHTGTERALTERISRVPPNRRLLQPEIRPELLDKNVNKKADLVELKNAAEDTILDYPEHWIHIYTDGSAFKATINAGWGALICFPDGSNNKLHDACGTTCSNYEAELLGIQAALKHLYKTFEENPNKIANTVIFSDAKSALQALENRNSNKKEVIETLLQAHKLLSMFTTRLVLQWVPGHINIPGNEKADRLAKQGSRSEQTNKPVTLQTAKQIIKQNYKEEWMNLWSRGTTGRPVFQHMNSVKPKDDFKLLQRKDQCNIFRLRTQHAPLNYHLNRINPRHPPMCPLCDHPYETVQHILFNCPKLQDLRQRFLPPTPGTDNSLYAPLEQLKRTSTFYNMALGRRAKALALLD